MHPFLDYMLKANLLLIFFGLFYFIFLKRETFYQLNRWYFIGSILVAIIAPLVTFTKTVLVDPIPVEYFVNDSETVFTSEVVEEPLFIETVDLQQIIVYLILFISSLLVIRKINAVAKLYHSIKKMPSLGKSNIKINANAETVYSFYKWIVVQENFLKWKNYQLILDHENIHLNQKHTFDLILVEIVAAVFWFNPLIKILQRHINSNLEFIVDAQMVQKTEPILYQKNLLLFQTQKTIQFANSYNASEIKSRILQLNSKKSTNMKKLKFLLATPILLAFFALFQIETVAQVKETTEVQDVSENDELEDSFYVMIHSKYDDAYYTRTVKMLREKYNLNVTIDNLKRNKDGELTSIKISCKDDNQYFLNEKIQSSKPFEPFRLYIYKNDTGKYYIETVSESEKVVIDYYKKERDEKSLNFDEETLKTDREIFDKVAAKFPIVVDGDLMTKKQLKKFDNTKIRSMTLAFDNIVKNTPTIVLSTTKTQSNKIFIFEKSNIGEIKIKGETATSDDLQKHIDKENTKKQSVLSSEKISVLESLHVNGKEMTMDELMTMDQSKHKDSNNSTTFEFKFAPISKQNIVYVINGKEAGYNDFQKINPDDIESITILKDQKSKEKYGSTTKDGVMVITTKAKKEVSLHQKNQALKARESAMKERKEAITERNELITQRIREREKSRQQLLNKRNEISEKTQQRRKELEKRRETIAKRKEVITVSQKNSDKKLLNDDYKTLTAIFNDVNKSVKEVEDENFKIISVKASIARKDGTKVEMSEIY